MHGRPLIACKAPQCLPSACPNGGRRPETARPAYWNETYGNAISQGGGQAAWIDPVHDAAGNMSLMPRPGDGATASQGLLCVYDAWNRLVEVYEDTETDHVLDAGEDTLIATYSYDGLHRRIRKDIDGGDTYDYYYNTAWQVLEIRKDQDTDPYEQYLWDIRYIDAPIARNHDPDCDPWTYNSQVHYYCYDANFNVTALVEADGDVIERYCYDAYGQVTVLHGGASDGDRGEESEWDVDEDGSDVANEILFCGYRLDSETGLYHVRFRMYHTTLGRWTARDREEYAEGMSLYEYCVGSPVNRVDWRGRGSQAVEQCLDDFEQLPSRQKFMKAWKTSREEAIARGASREDAQKEAAQEVGGGLDERAEIRDRNDRLYLKNCLGGL